MKMKTENRWGYGLLLLTLLLVVGKLVGWVNVSWSIVLFPILFPLIILFILAIAFCLMLIFAFLFVKAPKDDEDELEDEKKDESKDRIIRFDTED